MPWVPTSINFSKFEYDGEQEVWGDATTETGVEDSYTDGWLESVILEFLGECEDDTQRILLLVLVLKDAGYKLEHSDISKSLNLNERVYYRKLKSMRDALRKQFPHLR